MITALTETAQPMVRRTFLFLQGPTSTVFRDLGRALAARGHGVVKVNLCPGDWLFWRGQDTLFYNGSLANWPRYLETLTTRYGVTDIVYFADRFPYHRAAQRVAQRLGLRRVSMEYGYLRPDWLVLEEGGQSSYSLFPEDPTVLRASAEGLPQVETAQIYRVPARTEAVCETVFHVANGLLRRFVAPDYTPDRYYPELREFPAYIPRLIRRWRNAAPAANRIEFLRVLDVPRFLVPLQMQNDYQLRHNAPPGYQHLFVTEVMSSFANAAPQEAVLIFKLHPLDNGIERWDRVIPRLARSLGLADRVEVLDGGDLAALFAMARGCVVINSTTGLQALQAGVPTRAMGVAVYDIAGLTDQRDLDAFWQAPRAPDPVLVDLLVRALAHAIHVRGSVYGAAGRAAFIKNAVERLEGDVLNRHGLRQASPPRLAKARAMGIAVDNVP
jgi:capsular polysaccharide export protein